MICGQKVLCVSSYRPPDADINWTEKFNNFLDLAGDLYANMIISGDMNFPKISWDLSSEVGGANETAFVNTVNDHFLFQVNNFATREQNVLDLIITSMPDRVSVSEVLSPEQSGIFTDHSVLSFVLSAFVKSPTKIHRTVYDYAKGDFPALRTALGVINLSSVLGSDDINADWQKWKDTFLAATADYIPVKKLKGRNPVPWVNGPILNMIKKKDSVRQKLRKSPSSYLKKKFGYLRKTVKRMLSESRERYLSSVESDFKYNPKRFWSLLRLKSKSRCAPNCISMANGPQRTNNHPSISAPRISAENPRAIASLFNRYFVSVFTNNSLEPEDVESISDYNPEETILTEVSVSEGEVLAVLQSLDVSKATGPDGIPARLLKETADVIAPSLCSLFNKSLSTGSLPTEWKLANVVPIYKKGNREYVENYRPISLLSIISKVLERCVFNSIKDKLYSLVNQSQHGFISAKSSVTNLIETFEYIGSVLDNGGQIDTVYLDMSKAFDKVDHSLLISKLRGMGFGGIFLHWLKNYLTDRYQRVTVLGATSDSMPVKSGVPQGSLLGPALFLLFVNDLPKTITSSHIAMYADDTKVFKAIQTPRDAHALQEDLSALESWSLGSGLQFNEEKSHVQMITRKTKPVITTYMMNDISLQSTSNERDLGVLVSFDLRWKEHVLEQTAGASRMLGYVKRNTRNIGSISIRKSIYLSIVRSQMGYATQVWAPQSIELILKLERVQRRATRYILSLPFTSSVSYASRLQTLLLLPICYWHEYLDLVFFFKATHGLVNLSSCVIPNVRNARRTRSSANTSTKYVVPKSKTTTHQRSYMVRVTRIWNILGDSLNTDSLSSFKKSISNYYLCALNTNFDIDNPRTFKTICCKCNTARRIDCKISCCF